MVSNRFFSFLFFCLFVHITSGIAQDYQVFRQQRSLSYDSVILQYTKLDKTYKNAKLIEYGKTDIGKPLHVFVISSDAEFNPDKIRKKNRRIILVNNGIHAGEPEGVDASLWLATELLEGKNGLDKDLGNTVLCIIPFYNIGGALNRSSYHRANQQYPLEHGFRGNARNLDLNRDFVKADSHNARSFSEIFHTWQPDVFVDTHTTDGSEHQYVLTLIHSNPQILTEPLSSFFSQKFLPEMQNRMVETGYEMAPYVQTKDWIVDDPSKGIIAFYDSPKYSTGYTTMFNTMSFLTENHVYKPYDVRVHSVYVFLHEIIKLTHKYTSEIGIYRNQAKQNISAQTSYEINFETDTVPSDSIWFKGYEALWQTSELTGAQTFGYDMTKPYNKKIPFFGRIYPTMKVEAPKYYVVPFAWYEVIERLKLNHIQFSTFTKDTILEAEIYFISNYEPSTYLTGGHKPNNNVKVRTEIRKMKVYAGDILVSVNQPGNRYIVQMLEPHGADSFFQWNFFDEILERREYFSPYGFEPKAVEYLKNHPDLKLKLEEKKKNDTEFANNHYLQLKFIYDNSPYAEPTYKRYPILRLRHLD